VFKQGKTPQHKGATDMATTKSIFEKTYMTTAQAEAAAVKAMGATWADAHEVVANGKRFAVAAKMFDESPKAAQARVEDLKARLAAKKPLVAEVAEVAPVAAPAPLVVPTLAKLEHEEMGKAQAVLAKALDALHQVEKTVHDVAENLTLAQALAESGETLDDLKDDGKAPARVGNSGCGHTNCPGCGIDLDNGVCDWNSMVELHGSKARDYQQHEWSCLACGAEWGAKRAGINIQKDRQEQNGVTRPSEGGVCAAIWAECDKRAVGGMVPPVKEMKAWALAEGVDQTTCLIQYYQWRKFNGVVGRAKEMPAK
jgi:hypothetical protein